MAKAAYHHGDLRRALLDAAAEAITDQGVAALSMRDLARRAGVSHAAPTHHFGDKAGLLTALATAGFEELAEALATSRRERNSLLELGVTYVRFALTRRAEFEVMYRPDLYHRDDPGLLAARAKAARSLYAVVADFPDGARPAAPTPGRPDGAARDSAGRDGDRAHGEDAGASTGDAGASSTQAPALSPDVRAAGLAAWSMAHGFATLWLSGAFPDRSQDPAEVARMLFVELRPTAGPQTAR